MFIITIQSGGIPVSRLVSLVCINNIIIINKKLHLLDFCLIRKVKVKKIEVIMFAKSSSHKYISTKTGTVNIKSPQKKIQMRMMTLIYLTL